jgi:glycosyltransferase involved in cell wall biosynthesis
MSEASRTAAERPLVTHFLYAYRQERTIRAAVESVLAQTWQPLEVILSDDCSPDGTFAIMEEMAAAYRGPHRIVLNRNPTNLGVGRHAAQIMERASGEFIVESGGDDISLPHRTERLVEAWLASGRRAKYVHSEKQDIDADGNPLPFAPRTGVLAGLTPLQMLEKKHALIGATAGWAHELVDRFGPIADVAAFHDYPLAFRALLLGDVVYLPEPLVLYRTGGVSRHRAQSYGYWWFHGDRIRYLKWDLEFHRSYRRDLDRLPAPDHAACVAVCDAFIRQAEFTLALAGMTRRQRLAALPRAARESLARRDPFFLRMAVKYLLDRPFMRYLDWRTGRRPPPPPRGGDPAAAT